MKFTVLLLSVLFYLIFASDANANVYNNIRAESSSGEGGNASVNININNNINTGSSSYTSTSKTDTKIDLQQGGNGTSTVKINGKEWKLDGPGEIHVDENSSPSNASTPTPAISPTPEESPTPTPEVLSAQDESKLTFSEKIKMELTKVKFHFYNFFANILNLLK